MTEVKESNKDGDIEYVLSELERTKIENETQQEYFQKRNVRIKPTQSNTK